MIRRPLRPTFSHIEKEGLLDALGKARECSVKYRSAQKFGSEDMQKADAVQAAIDDFAKVLTGDREFFALKSPSYRSE